MDEATALLGVCDRSGRLYTEHLFESMSEFAGCTRIQTFFLPKVWTAFTVEAILSNEGSAGLLRLDGRARDKQRFQRGFKMLGDWAKAAGKKTRCQRVAGASSRYVGQHPSCSRSIFDIAAA